MGWAIDQDGSVHWVIYYVNPGTLGSESQLARLEGIGPVRELYERCNTTSWVKLPIEDGIGPLKLFKQRSRWHRCGSLAKKSRMRPPQKLLTQISDV